jgi:hypothetical protein
MVSVRSWAILEAEQQVVLLAREAPCVVLSSSSSGSSNSMGVEVKALCFAG